jgi:adenylate kinase family enzyme
MTVKVLIMGLSGAGKTSTAVKLQDHLAKSGFTPVHVNSDRVREATDNWSFDYEGRIDATKWMVKTANQILNESKIDVIIYDTIACLQEQRDILDADITLFLDTAKSSKYADTDAAFERPENCGRVTSHDQLEEAFDDIVEQIDLITENRKSLNGYSDSI